MREVDDGDVCQFLECFQHPHLWRILEQSLPNDKRHTHTHTHTHTKKKKKKKEEEKRTQWV